MKKPCLHFKIILILISALFAASCYTYEQVRIRKTITLDAWKAEPVNRSRTAAATKNLRSVYAAKYFAKVSSPASLAALNNKGVDYAVAGRFPEAEKIFLEAAAAHPSSPVPLNNLGVVYEIFGRKNEAAEYYLKANLMEPDNNYFRKNYLSFEDTGR